MACASSRCRTTSTSSTAPAGTPTTRGSAASTYSSASSTSRSLSALLADLEVRDLLDRTLVVLATEFGRPAQFDGGGGRGHQATTFTMVLAGGGLRHRGAYGVTDDLSQRPVHDAV